MDPARLTHSGNRELLRRDLSVSLFLSSVLCLVIYGILSLAEPEPRMAHGATAFIAFLVMVAGGTLYGAYWFFKREKARIAYAQYLEDLKQHELKRPDNPPKLNLKRPKKPKP